MVESKFVVLQMIPHTLFIEWDFWTLFTSRFTVHDTVTSRFTVHYPLAMFTSRCEFTVHIYGIVHVYDTIHIYGTIHTTSFFFLNVHF